jgi:hypothetical protein
MIAENMPAGRQLKLVKKNEKQKSPMVYSFCRIPIITSRNNLLGAQPSGNPVTPVKCLGINMQKKKREGNNHRRNAP